MTPCTLCVARVPPKGPDFIIPEEVPESGAWQDVGAAKSEGRRRVWQHLLIWVVHIQDGTKPRYFFPQNRYVCLYRG